MGITSKIQSGAKRYGRAMAAIGGMAKSMATDPIGVKRDAARNKALGIKPMAPKSSGISPSSKVYLRSKAN